MFSNSEDNTDDQYHKSSTSGNINNTNINGNINNNDNNNNNDKKYKSKIMVLDDDIDIATIVEMTLQRNGYRNVSMFTDSSMAIRELGENGNGYALVISDIRMPSMNGFDIANHISKINSDIKVILMTAFEVSDDLLALNTKHGNIKCITEIIPKPISTKKLAKIISTL